MKKILLTLVLISIFVSAYADDLKATYLYNTKSLSITCPTELENIKYGVLDNSGKLVESGTIEKFYNSIAIVPFSKPVIGKYTVILKDANSNKLGEVSFVKEADPKWFGNKMGVTDDNWCPKPWTPLVVNNLNVSCTQRTYSINKFGMFDSVVSLKDNLLASPMVWKATVNGKEVTWIPKELKITKKANGVVNFIASLDSADVTLKSVGKIEFDGYSEVKTTFVNKKSSVTIDKLSLEIPYNSKFATLYHYFPKVPVWYGGVNVTKLNSGSVPEKWNSEHLPFVWIGNEDKGMQWLCSSDQYWKLTDKDKALNIVKNGDVTLFTLNIIDKPYTISKPINYTFSFQASPVKPASNEKYKTHYTYEGGLMDAMRKCALDNYDYMGFKGYKDYGVNTLTVFTWNEALGNPRPTIPDNRVMVRAVRDMTKQRDMKFLLFQVFLVSNKLPEYKYFDEVKVVDKNAYQTASFWNDTSYAVCQNSMWQDYWLEGVIKNIEEFDLDGIYTDSVPCIGYCANLNHGCGYIDDDDTVKSTVEYIAVRTLIKRLYKCLEEKRKTKDMLFVGHTSAAVYLPSISFTDFYLDTEHMMPIPRPFRVPLDAFRAEFMGHNFGVPSQCFSYEKTNRANNLGVYRDEMFALGLLHDSDYTHDHEVSTFRWQAEDAFGMSDVTFMPYWKDFGFTSPKGVYVSAYKKPNTSDLLVYVANFTENDITGKINLGKPISSIKGYYNADTSKVVNGEIEDTFTPWKAKIYIVKF